MLRWAVTVCVVLQIALWLGGAVAFVRGPAAFASGLWGFVLWLAASAGGVQLGMLMGSVASRLRARLRSLTVGDDHRRYCLLLRPFGIPEIMTTTTTYSGAETISARFIQLEEVIEHAIDPIPLVYLIPSDAAPTVGSHSKGSLPLRCDPDRWFAIIAVLMKGCRGVILVPGDGQGVIDELTLLSEFDVLDKTMVIIPPDAFKVREKRWNEVRAALSELGFQVPEYSGEGAAYIPDRTLGVVKAFSLGSEEELWTLSAKLRPPVHAFLSSLAPGERLSESYRKIKPWLR